MIERPTHNNDALDTDIQSILDFLFNAKSLTPKQQNKVQALNSFNGLDLAATYQLFALIQNYLPKRAKLLFAGEDYLGKKQVVLEVIHSMAEKN